ncbi:Gfo/Idh/MocA family oxidoreductase [Rhizobium sp. P38BS-XIX]|uniref:Gfo/Idh/MocA family protein n=1 Tax=Rhizobium sp. P38BS-XIX TaxID=2726740 RepID=UPI0014573465|nr:Gfo/Idh/MocA family oxidoreductase [Rhizobium sp. P38BS-XIX]NLS00991.1 Gfo/Idh/MocA family oxidoreductase [Rhizobium sp. P38BS-XIX]
MTKLRVAIIGLGMAAGHHARSLIDLADRVDVVGVYSPTETRREAFAAQYGFPPVADLDTAFDTRFADAVLILTPPNTHLELVERATKAGQHILLEKPLDISLERAKAAVSLARNAGVLLAVVLQNRFRSSFLTLQSMLQARELGTILEASMSLRNWRPQQYYDAPGRGTLARDGGGVLLTQGIHTIDLLLALAGTPSNIAAFSRTTSIHRMETEDLVNAVFSFESGATGTLNATTCAYPGYPERIELICSKGTALLTGDSLQANLHDGRMVSAGANMAAGFGSDPMAFGHDLHRELLGNFIDAITKGDRLVVNGDDALRAHAFIDEILRSKR